VACPVNAILSDALTPVRAVIPIVPMASTVHYLRVCSVRGPLVIVFKKPTATPASKQARAPGHGTRCALHYEYKPHARPQSGPNAVRSYAGLAANRPDICRDSGTHQTVKRVTHELDARLAAANEAREQQQSCNQTFKCHPRSHRVCSACAKNAPHMYRLGQR
jgi:hypothetical protein